MKITMRENPESFTFDFVPESAADAALLTRFVLNRTKEVKNAQFVARRDLTIDAWLELGKRKNDTGEVKP